uniref:cytochrome P450 2F1-like n=1 Tax=Macaca mulatta TaxID=9544 RepID=UPI0010A293FD|nr:cytochrome P450 2F1-like [Macaca mulatta]
MLRAVCCVAKNSRFCGGYCCCGCAAGSCGFCAVCGIDTCFWGVVKQHVVTMCLCSAPQDTLPWLSRMLCKLMVLLHEVWCAAHRVFLIHSPPSGEPFDPTFVLSHSVSNIICSVLFASCFHYDDERLLTSIRLINDNFQIMSSPWGEVSQLYNIFPSLLDWVPGPHQRIFQNFKRLRDLIAHSVHDHQASLDPRFPRDFIDCFLTKMAEEEDPLSHFRMDTLLMTTHNLVFGGTKTVGTTLRHAFLALMKYPKVQGEAHPHSSAEVPMCSSLTPEQGATAPPPAPPPRSEIASC